MKKFKKTNNQKINKKQKGINKKHTNSEFYKIISKESEEETKRKKEKYEKRNNREEKNIYTDNVGETICVKTHVFSKPDNEEVLTYLEVFEPYKKLSDEYKKKTKDVKIDSDIPTILPLTYNIIEVIKGKEKKRDIIITDTENLANYLSKSGLVATTFLSGTDEPIETEYLNIFRDTNLILIGNFCIELRKNLEKVANKVITINSKKEFYEFCEEVMSIKSYIEKSMLKKSDNEFLFDDLHLCVELNNYDEYLEKIKQKDTLPDKLLELVYEEMKM